MQLVAGHEAVRFGVELECAYVCERTLAGCMKISLCQGVG